MQAVMSGVGLTLSHSPYRRTTSLTLAARTLLGVRTLPAVVTSCVCNQVRDAIHFGAYIEHKHSKTGEEALPVAYLTKNSVIIDMLRFVGGVGRGILTAA